MKIAILSDTHGLLRPRVVEFLKTADVILHGGDINRQSIVDELRQYAPLYVVRGNNDKEWAEGLPHHLTVTLGGLRFFMVHNKKEPARRSDRCGRSGVRALPQISAGGKEWGILAQSRLLRTAPLPPGDHHDDGRCGGRQDHRGEDHHPP